jgi:hypothetical protein
VGLKKGGRLAKKGKAIGLWEMGQSIYMGPEWVRFPPCTNDHPQVRELFALKDPIHKYYLMHIIEQYCKYFSPLQIKNM